MTKSKHRYKNLKISGKKTKIQPIIQWIWRENDKNNYKNFYILCNKVS